MYRALYKLTFNVSVFPLGTVNALMVTLEQSEMSLAESTELIVQLARFEGRAETRTALATSALRRASLTMVCGGMVQSE